MHFAYNAKTWRVHEQKVYDKIHEVAAEQGYDPFMLVSVRKNPFLPGKMGDGTLTSYIRHMQDLDADLATVRTIAEP